MIRWRNKVLRQAEWREWAMVQKQPQLREEGAFPYSLNSCRSIKWLPPPSVGSVFLAVIWSCTVRWLGGWFCCLMLPFIASCLLRGKQLNKYAPSQSFGIRFGCWLSSMPPTRSATWNTTVSQFLAEGLDRRFRPSLTCSRQGGQTKSLEHQCSR